MRHVWSSSRLGFGCCYPMQTRVCQQGHRHHSQRHRQHLRKFSVSRGRRSVYTHLLAVTTIVRYDMPKCNTMALHTSHQRYQRNFANAASTAAAEKVALGNTVIRICTGSNLENHWNGTFKTGSISMALTSIRSSILPLPLGQYLQVQNRCSVQSVSQIPSKKGRGLSHLPLRQRM